MTEPLRIEIAPGESVSALVYPAAGAKPAGITLLLGHGAGAGQTSAQLRRVTAPAQAKSLSGMAESAHVTDCRLDERLEILSRTDASRFVRRSGSL